MYSLVLPNGSPPKTAMTRMVVWEPSIECSNTQSYTVCLEMSNEAFHVEDMILRIPAVLRKNLF